MMKTTVVSILSLLFLTGLGFLALSLSSDHSHHHHPTIRGALAAKKYDIRGLQDEIEVEEIDEGKFNLATVDPFTFSPQVFNNMVYTWFDDEQTFEDKKAFYQRMVVYHSFMSPCFHKTYWAAIGFLNPWLKEGMPEPDENGVYDRSFLY